MNDQATQVTIRATVDAPVDKVWETWNNPQHVTQWNSASPEWHSPTADNDLREGGRFSYRMEAKDGSAGFDFWGTYDKIVPNTLLEYTMGDGRKVIVNFNEQGQTTEIVETFDAENQNPVDMQRAGWQAILDNFKKYTENLR